MEAAGKVNVYRCSVCLAEIITVNRVTGTTPFLVSCENPHCATAQARRGTLTATSQLYQVDQSLVPTHEWYRPTTAGERKRLTNLAVREHVEMGGLLLRRIR